MILVDMAVFFDTRKTPTKKHTCTRPRIRHHPGIEPSTNEKARRELTSLKAGGHHCYKYVYNNTHKYSYIWRACS